MTIPGVGIRTAEAFAAYVDDIGRFGRIKQVGTYFGYLVLTARTPPATSTAWGTSPRTVRRPVRKMLTEAAWQGIRHSPTLGGFYQCDAVGHDDPQRRKIASLVATAHYLCRG